MRKKFIYFVLVPVLILLVVTYLFIDTWIESALESAGERIVGAKVEIDYLRVSLFPLGIRFARIEVADPNDPWKNLFETGDVRFSMDMNQLLRGKTIVETMEVNDCVLGTKRTRDGSLPGGRGAPTPASSGPGFEGMLEQVMARTVGSTPLFDPAMIRKGVNIDSLIRAQNFQTLALIDSLTLSVSTASARWDSVAGDVEAGKATLRKIEADIRAINPSGLKTPEQILGAVATVDNSLTTINALKSSLDNRQRSVRSYVENLTGAAGAIPRSVERDYRKVIALARLPDFNALGLAELLLGKQLLNDVNKYARWADIARSTVSKYRPEQEIEKPPRMKGQDIRFPVTRGYPKFWIKAIRISGGTDEKQDPDFIRAQGEASNISSDQRLAGAPLRVELEGSRGRSVSFSLGALVDRTGEEPLDRYHARAAGVPLSAFDIGRSDFLPSRITNARMTNEATVVIPGESFEANVTMRFDSLKLQFERDPKNIGERLAQEMLRGIRGFDAAIRVWKAEGRLNVAFSSNLDDQFAARAKDLLGAELARMQADIRSRVEGIVSQKRQEFERLYDAKTSEITRSLASYEELLKSVNSIADAKKADLLAQLEKQKKGAVDDVMKKLFKK